MLNFQVLLKSTQISFLSQGQNNDISSSTLNLEQHVLKLKKIKKDFFSTLEEHCKLSQLTVLIQRDCCPDAERYRCFYNVICGLKTHTKKMILNKFLILYTYRTFLLCHMPKT